MEELKNGAPEAGSARLPGSMAEPLREVENRWLALRAHVDEILVNQSAILSIREFVDVINKAIPRLQQTFRRGRAYPGSIPRPISNRSTSPRAS